jgi:hypothetical protein
MSQSRLLKIAQIQIMIALVSLLVKLIGIERTARWLTKNANSHCTPETNNLVHAMQLFQTQKSAVSKSFWRGNCLSRSLVLHWLLRRNGVDSKFRIGVRTHPSFKAHAWITFQGRPLNASRRALAEYQLVSNYKLYRSSEFE